jgi:hypothetical protein
MQGRVNNTLKKTIFCCIMIFTVHGEGGNGFAQFYRKGDKSGFS